MPLRRPGSASGAVEPRSGSTGEGSAPFVSALRGASPGQSSPRAADVSSAPTRNAPMAVIQPTRSVPSKRTCGEERLTADLGGFLPVRFRPGMPRTGHSAEGPTLTARRWSVSGGQRVETDMHPPRDLASLK